jgi:hypothetical protein
VAESILFNGVSDELAMQEKSYIQLINNKIETIENTEIQKDNAVLFDSFNQQLQTIDRQYDLCRKEIDKHGYTDELIQQVIYIYQLKLSVLQMMQKEVEKINQRSNKNNHEKEKLKIIY